MATGTLVADWALNPAFPAMAACNRAIHVFENLEIAKKNGCR
jgi:hypothetical protein